MNQQITQKIALDSCVVINIIKEPTCIKKIQKALKGKSIQIILCDVVLNEVHRIIKYSHKKIIEKISASLKRKISIVSIGQQEKIQAIQLSNQFHICHNGDNKILAMCAIKNYILVTSDKMLTQTSKFIGVPVFHPFHIGGI